MNWREVCDATGRLLCVEVIGTELLPLPDGHLCSCGAVSCCTNGRCPRHACATFVYVEDLGDDGKETP